MSRVDVNGYATGALQVFSDGAWGGVCSANFDHVDALVACRQLGFDAGIQLRRDVHGRESDEVMVPFAVGNLGCSGEEDRLLDCPGADDVPIISRGIFPEDYGFYDPNPGTCDPFSGTYAFVACGTETAREEGDLRLTGGAVAEGGAAQYGRLEVFHRGGWGTVCDNSAVNSAASIPAFSVGAAAVACRQLGFQEGFEIQALEDADEDLAARVPVVLAGAVCRGTEAALVDCAGVELGRVGERCDHFTSRKANVHLVCFNGPDDVLDGALRLAGGKSGVGYGYGRLEVFLRGFFSNVCSDNRFTPDSAKVACRQLGYDGGAALRFTQAYALSLSQVLFANLPVALAAVDCSGTEESLLECQRNDRLVGRCTNRTASTVLACANTDPDCGLQPDSSAGAVRLRGGFGTLCDPLHSGFVEVLHNGEWGSICEQEQRAEEGDNNLVADVVCRQLGFPHGTRVDPLTARTPIPNDSEDGIFAYNAPYYFAYSGMFDYAAVEESEEPATRFWLDTAVCRGPEERLVDCDLGNGFLGDEGSCKSSSHRMAVACRQFPVAEALEGVTTAGAEEGDLRLLDETEVDNWVTGRLQVFFEGSWGQVCGSLFDSADADVACRQLGHGAGTVVPHNPTDADLVMLRATPVFPEVALSLSGCTGSESRLLDCAADSPTEAHHGRGCWDADGEGLVLGCVASKAAGDHEEGDLRLTDRVDGATPGPVSGVLEVFHAGAWGSLCDGSSDGLDGDGPPTTQPVADVACRDLGFEVGLLVTVPDAAAAARPPWLASVRCGSEAATFRDCERLPFGDTSFCGASLRLLCAPSGGEDREVRLVGGAADPGGGWEYGRLEVFFSGFWSIVTAGFAGFGFNVGTTQVACRQLGYRSGVRLLAGRSSALPAPAGKFSLVDTIYCSGTEATVAGCDIEGNQNREYIAHTLTTTTGRLAVALLCTAPSGCVANDAEEPREGDVRLVALDGVAEATSACDRVHFGSVELFHDGRWGRICTSRSVGRPSQATLDAQVVCRQLGFPYGSVVAAEEDVDDYDTFADYSSPHEYETALVWATQVVCTGREERLLDCHFPEAFGSDGNSSVGGTGGGGGYGEQSATSSPLPADPGIATALCARADNRGTPFMKVACRQFELLESYVVRR